jgi:hypothetical protein
MIRCRASHAQALLLRSSITRGASAYCYRIGGGFGFGRGATRAASGTHKNNDNEDRNGNGDDGPFVCHTHKTIPSSSMEPQLEPRTAMGILTSAIQGQWSMITSQESFDAFTSRYKNGLLDLKEINVVEALALHHELNQSSSSLRHNEYHNEHHFDIDTILEEFGNGVPEAFQFYLETKDRFHAELVPVILRDSSSSNVTTAEEEEEDQVRRRIVQEYMSLSSFAHHHPEQQSAAALLLQTMVTPSMWRQSCHDIAAALIVLREGDAAEARTQTDILRTAAAVVLGTYDIERVSTCVRT